jgi:hypothetical protein
MCRFVAFLLIDCTPLVASTLNPLEFLQELDRQRQLSDEGVPVEDVDERVGIPVAKGDPLYDDSVLEDETTTFRLSGGELLRI